MRVPIQTLGLLLAAIVLCSGQVRAASLQISPVLVEVQAPAGAAAISLRNSGATPLTAQVRVFSWQQTNGSDQLIQTRNVVASPPFVEIPAKSEQIVRLVRLTKAAIIGEDSYSVLVDEVPQTSGQSGTAVHFAVRYSVPVFFQGGQANIAALDWRLQQQAGKFVLTARNDGDQHVRVSALNLSTSHGSKASFGAGLIGYVLGRSTAQWILPGALKGASVGDKITLTAETDQGHVQTVTTLQGSR
jgi:fimbrial chaperone protein